MKYLLSIFRITLLVAVVLALGRFADIKKAKAADCNIIASRTLDNSCEGQDVTISGVGVIVTVSGTHTFTNLTITNGAKVTQAAIAVSDINSNGTTLNTAGLNKKVDLTVTGTLSLTNQGRIDVSNTGFPSGLYSTLFNGAIHMNGFGPGGGIGMTGPTGGAYGGNAYWGGQHVDFYGSEIEPDENGSGGGVYEGLHGESHGGGIIKINAIKMVLDYNDQTYISANGGGGETSLGGAGGSIWLKVTGTLTTHADPSYSGPSAAGNISSIDPALRGGDGSVSILGSSEHFGTQIVAKGGEHGGAGGRIRIDIPSNITHASCNRIMGGDVIPAYCEGQDVTVSGTTINAGAVKVWQEDDSGHTKGTECGHEADSSKSNCDSKRHFTNLTVENGAVITHEAVTINDMYLKDSLANETTGTARWKKVDIEVTNNLTLESGGKIDVNDKGYPGGIIISEDTSNPNGYGPGRGLGSLANGLGGGYGGLGGSSSATSGLTYPADENVSSFLADSPRHFDFGSGGGAGWINNAGRGFRSRNGGAGGGRIHILSNRIKMSDSSAINANGQNVSCDGPPGGSYCHDAGYSTTAGGGGSGGTVWLETESFENPAGGNRFSVSGGQNAGSIGFPDRNGVSYIPSNPKNVNAVGGSSYNGVDYTNSGGGGGWIVLGPGPTPPVESRKVNVTVKWNENGVEKSVNFSEILSDITP